MLERDGRAPVLRVCPRAARARHRHTHRPSHPSRAATRLPPHAQAVGRWFADAYQDALRGDVKQQALLGAMLAEGYGCEKDLHAAKEWSERSWARGYQMKGVYDEL